MVESNEWLHIDDVLSPFGDSYRILHAGVSSVNPSDIVALSISVNDVLSSGKLPILAEKIKEKGWQDISPRTLHLVKLPNSKYTVESGGNHRAYYSRKLGLKLIKADVDVLIPNDLISPEFMTTIQKLDDEIPILYKKLRSLGRTLRDKDQIVSENDDYIELESKIDSINQEIQLLLKEEAQKLGLVNV
jgi:hypothetical protein